MGDVNRQRTKRRRELTAARRICRAVRAVLALLYGIMRVKGAEQSEFFLNSQTFRMSTPKIYCYVGNRLTQMNQGAASAFKTVVNEIGKEIWAVWQTIPIILRFTQTDNYLRDRRLTSAECFR